MLILLFYSEFFDSNKCLEVFSFFNEDWRKENDGILILEQFQHFTHLIFAVLSTEIMDFFCHLTSGVLIKQLVTSEL